MARPGEMRFRSERGASCRRGGSCEMRFRSERGTSCRRGGSCKEEQEKGASSRRNHDKFWVCEQIVRGTSYIFRRVIE